MKWEKIIEKLPNELDKKYKPRIQKCLSRKQVRDSIDSIDWNDSDISPEMREKKKLFEKLRI